MLLKNFQVMILLNQQQIYKLLIVSLLIREIIEDFYNLFKTIQFITTKRHFLAKQF
jgi:hypothetical protein